MRFANQRRQSGNLKMRFSRSNFEFFCDYDDHYRDNKLK